MTDTRARDAIADLIAARDHNVGFVPAFVVADTALAALSDAGLVVLDRTLLEDAGLLQRLDDAYSATEDDDLADIIMAAMLFVRRIRAAVVEAVGPTTQPEAVTLKCSVCGAEGHGTLSSLTGWEFDGKWLCSQCVGPTT